MDTEIENIIPSTIIKTIKEIDCIYGLTQHSEDVNSSETDIQI